MHGMWPSDRSMHIWRAETTVHVQTLHWQQNTAALANSHNAAVRLLTLRPLPNMKNDQIVRATSAAGCIYLYSSRYFALGYTRLGRYHGDVEAFTHSFLLYSWLRGSKRHASARHRKPFSKYDRMIEFLSTFLSTIRTSLD